MCHADITQYKILHVIPLQYYAAKVRYLIVSQIHTDIQYSYEQISGWMDYGGQEHGGQEHGGQEHGG